MQSNGKFVRTSFSNPIRGRGRGAPRRRNKGLRGMDHHVSAGVGPSGLSDVVPPDEETRDCGGWSTTSVRAAGHPDLGSWCFLRPGTLVFRNERSRCTKCTAASSIYYAFFGAASSKAKPTPSGSASQVRQRLAGPAAPSPHRRSLLIGEACASCAYIGRLGMRTVKVVPLPGMLST